MDKFKKGDRVRTTPLAAPWDDREGVIIDIGIDVPMYVVQIRDYGRVYLNADEMELIDNGLERAVKRFKNILT